MRCKYTNNPPQFAVPSNLHRNLISGDASDRSLVIQYECPGKVCAGCKGASPFLCKVDADCAAHAGEPAHTCKGEQTLCVAGVCSSGSDPGKELCSVPLASSRCGPGAAAERFVGRCESESFAAFPGCDEGKPANETSFTTVFGPDTKDNPCTDLYTNQVRTRAIPITTQFPQTFSDMSRLLVSAGLHLRGALHWYAGCIRGVTIPNTMDFVLNVMDFVPKVMNLY